MGIFLAFLLTGYIVAALPISDWAYHQLHERIQISRSAMSQFKRPSVMAQPMTEIVFALMAVACMNAVSGGRLGLVCIGIGLIAGNVWPWYGANRVQGRGSVVFAATLLVLAPQLFLFACIIWGVVFVVFRSTALSTIISSFCLPLAVLYWQHPDIYLVYCTVAAGLLGYKRLVHSRMFRPKMQRWVRIVVYIALLVCVLILGYANRYVYRGFGPAQDILRQGPSNLPVVALTFDDGPDPVFTPLVLDVLAEYDVRATFFLVGQHVEMYPDIARRIVAEGHEVGNHSYSHRNLWRMSSESVSEEIDKTNAIIYAATGKHPLTFRPPRGLYNEAVLDHLAAINQPMMLWSLSSQDWAEVSHRTIINQVLSNVRNGDIILFHDSGDLFGPAGGDRMSTVQALPAIIEHLQDHGVFFLTVTEMMLISGLIEDEIR